MGTFIEPIIVAEDYNQIEILTAEGLLPQWHSQPMPIRIIHIGAGATGLCTAYKMERQLDNYELICYEKNPAIGGTWYENTYPGCQCDVPAHNYTYTFEPNPYWSAYYAGSSEILRYFQRFHEKYNLGKYIKLNHKVLSADWREEKGQWKVEVEHNGEVFTDWCHILINGSGFLNKWKWPNIEGLHSFKGPVVHSAAWDHNIKLEDKRIAVLGTGSSAIQIIPEVQKVASKLKCFMRSNTWIAAPMPRVEVDSAAEDLDPDAKQEIDTKIDKFSETIQDAIKDVPPEIANESTSAIAKNISIDAENGDAINGAQATGEHIAGETNRTDEAKANQRDNGAKPKAAKPLSQDIRQYYYTPTEIKRLASDPEYLLQYRKKIEFAMNSGFKIFYKNSKASKMAQQYMASEMARRLNYHPILTKHLIPEWPVGCRRLTPGDGYLEALIAGNTEPIYSDIKVIDESGLTTLDGAHHEVDIIICATGFHMAWVPHFELRGIDSVRIQDAWTSGPNCYLGIAAPGFPNYWVMNGPRGNLCNGTVIPCFETQIDYVIKAAKKIQSDRIRAIDVKEHITTSLNKHVDLWHQGGVWSGDCKSWYKNNIVNGRVMCWGGSSLHYLKSIKHPRFEHYNVRYIDDDPWAFLGNGRTRGEWTDDFELMTPYLRHADTPWDIE